MGSIPSGGTFSFFSMKRLWYILFGLILLCTACGKQTTQSSDTAQADSTLVLKYAEGFKVDYFDDYKRVTVKNPWKNDADLAVYYLVKSDSANVPEGATKIRIPLKSIAATSCTHYEFLQILGEIETVSGICNPEMTYNATLRQRYADGKIENLGDAFNTDMEKLLALRPDILLIASYNQQDNNAQRLQRSQIPVVYNNEWTESSVLARAEWLKFVAAFFDKENIATEFFDTIENNYIEAKIMAQLAKNQPTVMAGGNFKGTWYMPGGASFMGQLFADAGADYFYKNDSTTGSLPLNFETVLHNFAQADVWLNAPTATMHELFAMDERHKLFQAAKNGEVFGFYARMHGNSANDFWESGVAHPDLILKDLIWALHPEISQEYTPTYICKLTP